MNRPDAIPNAVAEVIAKKWPREADRILKGFAEGYGNHYVGASTYKADPFVMEYGFDTVMGCYWVEFDGLYYGIELDGYIHT